MCTLFQHRPLQLLLCSLCYTAHHSFSDKTVIMFLEKCICCCSLVNLSSGESVEGCLLKSCSNQPDDCRCDIHSSCLWSTPTVISDWLPFGAFLSAVKDSAQPINQILFIKHFSYSYKKASQSALHDKIIKEKKDTNESESKITKTLHQRSSKSTLCL